MKSKLSIALGTLLILQSCMPASSPQAPQQTNQNTSGTQTGSLSDIGASRLMVVRSGSKVSLADLAKQSGSQLTVFQFSGTDCLPCRTESPIVTQALAKYGTKVARYVIFPNVVDDYSESAYLNFTKQYANNAPYVNDETLAVVKAVRANSDQMFGMYVLVNSTGLGQVLNMDQAYMQVGSTVGKILGQ